MTKKRTKEEKEYRKLLAGLLRDRLEYIDRNPDGTTAEIHDAIFPHSDSSYSLDDNEDDSFL
jgi:hypothetical protein